MNEVCNTCCLGIITCSSAISLCGITSITLIMKGIFELLLLPVSIPCSIYRKNKYNKLINEWFYLLLPNDQKICEIFFDGVVNYDSINSKISIIKIINASSESDKYIINIIPNCIYRNNRYFWNTIPNKQDFIKIMDNMLEKIKLLYSKNDKINIDLYRLHELLIENNNICSICQNDNMNINNTIITPCIHIFHNECLNKWLEIKKECPYCRAHIELN
jgi:hypothetical protein